MPNFAVEYTYAPDEAALRDEHRPAHRQWLGEGYESGVIRLVGPYTDGSGALLIVSAESSEAVGRILAEDPFARAGAIAGARFTEWLNVFGPFGE
ncbi:YciI family protein [Gordonia crocea]|uniref:YCII-related domain-containing protein n=1 Tax=Gordonia crocea TaxID=589162 RepID=A0A7M3SUA8_9ACTN|nr:YciI family protein [Gordonia crocea]GED96232.1 hypothetical protein nbrc107697_02710 [Gordonia crocea]